MNPIAPASAYINALTEKSLRQLSDQRRHMPPSTGLIVFLPETQAKHIPLLQAWARELGIHLLGAVFPALVTPEGLKNEGAVFTWQTQGLRYFLEEFADESPDACARQLVHRMTQPESAPTAGETVFLVFDGMLPTIGSIMMHLYVQQSRHVFYAGINAGSERFEPIPCLFDQDRCIGHGVLGWVLPAAHGIAVEHGYPVDTPTMNALSTELNHVNKLNGRPAMEVYREMMSEHFGIDLTPDNFYHYAVHFPFGLIGLLNVCVRIPVGFTPDGAIRFIGEIPAHSNLRLIQAPRVQQTRCIEKIGRRLGNCQDANVWTFYCAGRRMHFESNTDFELNKLCETLRQPALYGALSLGEIYCDPDTGIPEFHNAAVLCVKL